MWLSSVHGPHMPVCSSQCLGVLLMRWGTVSWGISSQTRIRDSVSSWRSVALLGGGGCTDP